MFSVKELVESSSMKSVPSNYVCHKTPEDNLLNYETESIPTIDFLQLTSSNPIERSKAIQQLGDACRDWGFFMVFIYLISNFTSYMHSLDFLLDFSVLFLYCLCKIYNGH